MFFNNEDQVYRYKLKLRNFIRSLMSTSLSDGSEIYKMIYCTPVNNVILPHYPSVKHLYNMLYVIRVETDFTGRDFLVFILKCVIHTLKTRDLTQEQQEICLLLVDIILAEINLYKRKR